MSRLRQNGPAGPRSRQARHRGAQGIILGCTEIELLIGQEHCPVPVLATTALHAVAALDAALPSDIDSRQTP